VRCPFLSEETVRSCLAAPYRKPLPVASIAAGDERCTSPSFTGCTLARQNLETLEGGRCPLVSESLVQFCTASAVHTYVPWSDAQGSRCRGPAHRYCSAYLEVAAPGSAAAADTSAGSTEPAGPADELSPVEQGLAFTENHFWCDESDTDLHVGIDRFAADVLGTVDWVRFGALKGRRRPIVVLGVGDDELTLVYPAALEVSRCNVHLRNHPEDLTRDPYGAGWLFEAARTGDWRPEKLRHGDEAAHWLREERHRLTHFVQSCMSRGPIGSAHAGDGGTPVRGLARCLDGASAIDLYAEFFRA